VAGVGAGLIAGKIFSGGPTLGGPPPSQTPGRGRGGKPIEVPEGGPTYPGGPTPSPLNKKIGVPTLPFIA